MAKISTYEEVLLPKLDDELIGTSVGGSPANVTFNFSLQQLLDLFVPNIPSNNLQGVLDLGNTATQDINLTGTINTVTLNATGNTLLKNTYLNGPVRISGPLSDVYNTTGTNGQVLSTTGSSTKWITLPTYVALTATAPIIYNSGTGNLSITQSSSVTNGYLSSANWSTFNQKQSAISLTTVGSSGASTFLFDTLNIPNYTLSGLGGVPTSRTLTINGVTYDLSSNRSWTISGGIASVTATSPAFSSGGANPNITIQASGATQDGYLSSSDWTIFNGKQNALGFTPENVSNKVTSISAASTNIEYPSAKLLYDSLIGLGGVSAVTATSPVSSSGGSTPDISISQSGASTSGYLSTTDWNTFNNKQDSGSYITSLTGEATATGPGAASVTLGNSAVIGKVLTGLSTSTGGSIVATDSILTAFGKVQNQITGIVGGVTYQGVWDAATNVPPLTSSVGTQGYYYVVNVAGSTNLNGITDWKVGDWAIFNGTAWNKVDNTDSVSSVNGQTGAVSLTTDNVSEGIINLYYLDSRARAALSFAAGSGAYNSTSGVITIPTNTSQLTNGAAFITLASLTASSPLSYNNTTGAFSISQSSGSVDGYLSSTDWTTFNSKGSGTVTSVSALTLGTTGTDLSSTVATGTTTPVITLNVPTASATNRGALSSADWTTFDSKQNTITPAALTKTDDTNVTLTLGGSPTTSLLAATSITVGWTGTLADSRIASAATWNAKQNALSGSGIVQSTAGTISYISGTSAQFVKGDGSLDSTTYGIGTVTSVGLSMPLAFSVASSPIIGSGTIAVTATGTATQYIRGDGQLATLPSSGGGGSSVFYYLNNSITGSVVGYQQMSKVAVIGGGSDASLAGNGLIAQFITDVNDPNRTEIPSGAWNFEMWFSASSGGGTPAFYVQLLKYDGSTFTSISSGIANPESITGGTSIDLYLTSIAVPYSLLTITDRLAVRVYIVNSVGGRTMTLHTEDNHLCQITTTFASGVSSINGLNATTQYLAVGTAGTDFAISSLVDTHTFNLPSASATNRGALSTTDWSAFNAKQNALSGSGIVQSTAGTISYISGTSSQFIKGDGSLDSNVYITSAGTANIAGGTLGAIPYQSAINTTTVLAATATANKILLSGASAAPTWSIPTFPNASATTRKIIVSDGTNWVASTETYAVPGTSGNVLTSDGTNWISSPASGGGSTFTVSVISTNTAAVKNYIYVLTASLTLTLPASPSVGDTLKVSNQSGVLTCVIARNSLNIMGLAQDLTIDKLNIGMELVYTGATYGWVIR